MKPQRKLLIASFVMAHSFLMASSTNAEIPRQSQEKLQASASHVLSGTVERRNG